MHKAIKSLFLLNPELHYLNHGSFGACPRPVFDEYQRWQVELERNPIDYFTRQLQGLFSREASGPLEVSRQALSDFVHGQSEGLVFTPNVTVALNAVAYSISLNEGDEVLTTDHEYGTIQATWSRKCEQSGAHLKKVPISLPVLSQSEFVEHFWGHVTYKTRVILMSHITSATALVLPVEEICKRARKAGIITVIDGAHAVGQLPLDMTKMDADFYTSNCHKWLLTPKGTAFLYVHQSQRSQFEPLIISWAEINQPSFSLRHEMWGTRDMSAFLSIPAALKFREEHDWDERSRESQSLVHQYRDIFCEAFNTPAICDPSWLGQMASIILPKGTNPLDLWQSLWTEEKIEAMITRWDDVPLLRIGFNAYNEVSELELLLEAIQKHQHS